MEGVSDFAYHTAEPCFATDRDQRIVAWNKAIESLLGCTKLEVAGLPCYEVFRGRDAHGNLVCCKGCPATVMVRRNEPIHSYEIVTRNKTGVQLWLRVTRILSVATGLRPPSPSTGLRSSSPSKGEVIIHLVHDVTHEHHLVKALEEILSQRGVLASLQDTSRSRDSPLMKLTNREQEVLRLLIEGLTTKEIATRLFVSPITVHNHVRRILHKLNVRNRAQAVALALTHRLQDDRRK